MRRVNGASAIILAMDGRRQRRFLLSCWPFELFNCYGVSAGSGRIMAFDVYGIGNALVDIQAQVSDDVVAQTEFAKGIMTLVDDDKQQQILESIRGMPLNQCAGGSAANTVVGIADFGGAAAYCGKVGNDAYGQFFADDMRKIGVAADVPPSDTERSGTCAVLITPDAQRTMMTHLGAAVLLSADDVEEEKIRNSKYVYIEGYLLSGDSSKDAAYRAIELALENPSAALDANHMITLVK